MDKRPFIHIFLIAALCYGQLVASVHMVGHFQTDVSETHPYATEHHSAEHFDHTIKNREAAVFSSSHTRTFTTHSHPTLDLAQRSSESAQKLHDDHHADEPDGHSSSNHDSSNHDQNNHDSHNNSDCAIYHAYLGQNICPSAFASGFTQSKPGISYPLTNSAFVIALAVHKHRIRGPPKHS